MKKILFIMLIMGFFSPLINAWQLITRDFVSSTQTSFQYYYDYSTYQIRFQSLYNGNPVLGGSSPNDTYFWSGLSTVRQYNGTQQYKTINYINKRFKEEPIILNDFYQLGTQLILNFFYNPSNFNKSNHINYSDYKILYNDQGLAVESIVGGVWKGLYNTQEELENSGYLYEKKNNILYYNGEPASLMENFTYKLTRNVKGIILSTFALNIFGLIICSIFVIVIFRFSWKLFYDVLRRTRINFTFLKHW